MLSLAGIGRAAAALLALFCLLSAAPVQAQVDIPGNKSSGATLPKGKLLTSAINFAGDADWFKIALNNSNSYAITTTGPAVIRIYRADGTAAASSGTSRSYVWRSPANGTYFVAAKHSGGAIGSYTIKVALYDSSANSSTERRMTIGRTSTGTMVNTGNIDFLGDPLRFPPDQDWYRVELGTSCYQVRIGFPLAFSSLGDRQQQVWTRITSFDSSLAPWPEACQFACDAAAGCAGGFDFVPPAAGTYFIEALAYPAGTTVNGLPYSVTVTETPAEACVRYDRTTFPSQWNALTRGGVGCCDPRDPGCRSHW